jgi:hypothetical protein
VNNRRTYEILFTAALLAMVCWAVWEGRDWTIKPRLFPWAIGIPLAGMLAAQLVMLVIRRQQELPATAAEPTADEVEGRIEAERARRRGISIVGWLLGFLGAIWLLGFPAGGTLGTLAYLKLAAREKWPISLAIAGGTAVFFALMINGLNTPFPRGTLFELFGG